MQCSLFPLPRAPAAAARHRQPLYCPPAARRHPQQHLGRSAAGRRRVAVVVRAGDLPSVDWTRRSLQQILFVDRSDTVRARFAVGMFERVAGWAGCSRCMQAWPAGLDAEPGSRLSMSTQASLFSLAASWKLRPHLFTSARQQFDDDDVDRFELIVCLDSAVQTEVLKLLSSARPAQPGSYVRRICCLTDFVMYCPDEALLLAGSGGLLDKQLRSLVRLALPSLRPCASKVAAAAAATGGGRGGFDGPAVAAAAAIPAYLLPTGIERPSLQGQGGMSASRDEEAGGGPLTGSGGSSSGSDRWERAEQWDRMALLMAVCCAGLVRYLLDCRPDDTSD